MELYWYRQLQYQGAKHGNWSYVGLKTLPECFEKCVSYHHPTHVRSSYDFLVVSDYEFTFCEEYDGKTLAWSYRAAPDPTEPSWVS